MEDRAAEADRLERAKVNRRAWGASALAHLVFFVLIGIEVYFHTRPVLDRVFYVFCTPGLLIGFPIAMLFGRGGPHGEGVFFGILFGLPANLFFYRWVATRILRFF